MFFADCKEERGLFVTHKRFHLLKRMVPFVLFEHVNLPLCIQYFSVHWSYCIFIEWARYKECGRVTI